MNLCIAWGGEGDCVIASDSLFKENNDRFTTVPLKP